MQFDEPVHDDIENTGQASVVSKVRPYYSPAVHGLVDGFELTRTEAEFDIYQHGISDLLYQQFHVIVGAFMGSGKTACALRAATRLLDEGKVRKVLIVAPRAVALDTWPVEFLIWSFCRRFNYTVIVGTEEQREAALRKRSEFYIVSRDNYRWLLGTVGLERWPFDLLIYDEISRLKAGKLKTTASLSYPKGRLSEFGCLMRTRSKFKRVWGLTGTPASNGLIDLWGPVFLLDRGQRLGVNRDKFLKKWFRQDKYTYEIEPFDHSEKEILDRVKDVMFCLREEDYLDLSPLVIKDRWVSLDPEDLKSYRRFKRTLVLEEHDIEAANSGVLANKLLQFANGSVYANLDESGGVMFDLNTQPVAKHIHDRKLDELESVFSESGGRSVLVAYSYRFDLHAIKKRFPWVRIYGETSHDLRDWNNGKLRALVLHPASAGHGLNFQYGGHIAVWYGLNWSLELYQQFNKRLHRRGQTADHVWLYRILARDTYDERVSRVLEDRNATQNQIVDSLRVFLGET